MNGQRLQGQLMFVVLVALVFSIAVGIGTAIAVVVALEILSQSGVMEVLASP